MSMIHNLSVLNTKNTDLHVRYKYMYSSSVVYSRSDDNSSCHDIYNVVVISNIFSSAKFLISKQLGVSLQSTK